MIDPLPVPRLRVGIVGGEADRRAFGTISPQLAIIIDGEAAGYGKLDIAAGFDGQGDA